MEKSKIDGELLKYVNDAALIEDELTTEDRPAMSLARNAFRHRFNTDGDVYTKLKDYQYYLGGYPSPDSAAKIDVFLQKTGQLVSWYHALGRLDELNNTLDKDFGFKLVPTENYKNPTDVKPEKPQLFNKFLKMLQTNPELPEKVKDYTEKTDGQEIAQFLINVGLDVQGVICKKADEIKINIGECVQSGYGLEVPRFRDVVKVKSKINLSKCPISIIEHNQETVEQHEMVVEISTEISKLKNE